MRSQSAFVWCCGFVLMCLWREARCLDSKGETPTVFAVSGETAAIPCNVTAPLEEEEATMILWYRLDLPNPIYTLDVRGVPFKLAKHFPAPEMGGRLVFDVDSHPPVLNINPVGRGDQEEYKCRVDMRRSRTLILHTRLKVIVPPSDPIIMDEHGQRVRGLIGPYDEGARLILICDADGGDPTPAVTWWRGESLLDDKFIVTKQGFVRNKFVLPQLDRSYLLAELSCQASNTNLTRPRESKVVVDINLYPLSVTIVEQQYPLVAGEVTDIVCETVGSRPRPLTTWSLDNMKAGQGLLEKARQRPNVTSSVYRFVPKPEDNGRRLACKSVNLALPNVTLESEMLLRVHFIPILNISIANFPQDADIIEGADVQLVCKVWANPKMSEVTWTFNDQLIAVNQTQGITTSVYNLTLLQVGKKDSGRYRCLASNTVGQGSSRNLDLVVKYAPVCKQSYPRLHGVGETESTNVTCDVDAEPPAGAFRWSFVNDFESVVLQNWTSGETGNVLPYSPRVDNGYGMLSCWGRNSVGLQLDPCLTKVVPAGAPEPPHGCSLLNQTTTDLTVSCEPGYNGSLFQTFHIEVYGSPSGPLVQNLTSAKGPVFKVIGLEVGSPYLLVVYASNSKGRSEVVSVSASTLLPAEKRTAAEASIFLSTSALVAFFSASGLIACSALVLVLVRYHPCKRKKRKESGLQEFPPEPQTIKKELEESQDPGEKGPDIIPFTIESEVSKIGEQILVISSPDVSPVFSVRQKYKHTVL